MKGLPFNVKRDTFGLSVIVGVSWRDKRNRFNSELASHWVSFLV